MGGRFLKDWQIIAVFSIIIFFSIQIYDNSLIWDENVYLGNARFFTTGSNFFELFRFPLLSYMISWVWFLTGESILLAKLIMTLFSIGTVLLVYIISSNRLEGRQPVLLSLLFAICPALVFFSHRVYPDIPALFFILLSFHFLEGGKKCYFLSGAMSSLAFLMKFSYAIFPLCVAIFLLFKRKYRELMVFVAAFILVLIPWLIHSWIVFGNPVFHLSKQLLLISKYTGPVAQSPLLFLYNIFINMGLLMILVPTGFLRMYRKKRYETDLLILLYTVFFFVYYLIFVNLKLERYVLGVMPFLLLFAFFGLESISKWRPVIRRSIVILIVISLLVISVWGFIRVWNESVCFNTNAFRDGIDYICMNTDQGDTVISNAWVWIGYECNLEVYSIWGRPQEILERYIPSYFIYYKWIGHPYNQSTLDNHENLTKVIEFADEECGRSSIIYRPSDDFLRMTQLFPEKFRNVSISDEVDISECCLFRELNE